MQCATARPHCDGRERSCAGSSPEAMENSTPAAWSLAGTEYAVSYGSLSRSGIRLMPRTMTGTLCFTRSGATSGAPSPPTTSGR